MTREDRGECSAVLWPQARSDLSGASNIIKKASDLVVSTIRKALSFIVDHNPVAPVKGCGPQTPGTLALQRGEEVSNFTVPCTNSYKSMRIGIAVTVQERDLSILF